MRGAKLLIAVLIFGLFAIPGCDFIGGSDSDGGGNNNNGAMNLSSDRLAIVDAETAFANVEDATLDDEMAMRRVLDNDGDMIRPDRHPDRPGSHLRYILRFLDISQEQFEEIVEAMKAYRRTVHAALEGLREVNKPIVEAANAERRMILAALEAGEITREEAMMQLQALSQRTREAIRSNPENAPFLEAICEARRELFETIREILSADDQTEWDGWTRTSALPCSGGTD
jgi:branched-subunit amino acid aminotransferase/4-amino-4-deoxychorismate lyase